MFTNLQFLAVRSYVSFMALMLAVIHTNIYMQAENIKLKLDIILNKLKENKIKQNR